MKDGHGAHSVLTDASSILRRRNRQGLSSICQGPRMRQNRMAGRRSQHWHIEAASGQPRPSRPYGAPQDEAGERLQPGSTGSVAPHFSQGSPRNSRAGRLQIGMEAGELPYRHQHRQEAATGLRQAIFDMRRLLAEVAPGDKSVVLELSQMLSQHFLRDVWNVSQQLRRPHRRLGEKAEQDRQLPSSADHPKHPVHMCDRAIRTKADFPFLTVNGHF